MNQLMGLDPMVREILSRAFGACLLLAGLALIVGGLWGAVSEGRWSLLGACLLGGFIALHGLGRAFPGQPPPLPIETGDPTMAAAMAQAQQELQRFAAGLTAGKQQALVKYAMDTGYGEREHVWAVAHSMDDDAVITSLASEPVGDVEAEVERTQLSKTDIEDWLLVDEAGTMEGGFTQIAMAKIYHRDKGYVPYAIRKTLSQFKDLQGRELAELMG